MDPAFASPNQALLEYNARVDWTISIVNQIQEAVGKVVDAVIVRQNFTISGWQGSAIPIFKKGSCQGFIYDLLVSINKSTNKMSQKDAEATAKMQIAQMENFINNPNKYKAQYGGPSPITVINGVTYITAASASVSSPVKYYDGLFTIDPAEHGAIYIGEIAHRVGVTDMAAAQALGYRGAISPEASTIFHRRVGARCGK